jgi:hypothetical protein
MLKEKIKYVDFNGLEREEEFFFNMTRSEIAVMELSKEGGLVEWITSIIAKKDGEKIITFFQDFVLRSYGEKSQDGRAFVKSPELSARFSQTPAYDILFMRLVTDPEAAAAFLNAVIPPKPAEPAK